MRYIVLTICLVLFVGCDDPAFYEIGPAARFYQMEGRWPGMPEPYYAPDLWPMDFVGINGYIEADSLSDLERQHRIDAMLWEHEHGASFPFERPYP